MRVRLRAAVESLKNFFGGFDAVILGFLENGDTAEVGVGEEDAFIPAREAAAFFGEN